MKKTLLIAGIVILAGLRLTAQSAGLGKIVSLHYQSIPLEAALQDISKSYGVYFSYSKDFIPLEKMVSVDVYDQTLAKGLEALLASTKIVFAPIGNHIVLKINPHKKIIEEKEEELIGAINDMPILAPRKVYTSTFPRQIPVERKDPVRPTPLLRSPDFQPLDWTEDMAGWESETMLLVPYEAAKNKDPFYRLAQVSVVPMISSKLRESEEAINNVSVNVLWGKNGGVNGFEIGGLVNSIEGDVYGVQIAGMANLVRGTLNGVSSKGKNKKIRAGLQISGITNVASSARGAQITLGINHVFDGDLQGAQFAGLANDVRGNVVGWQFAGLINNNRGNAGLQIAGLYNRADTVSKAQIGAFNRARIGKGLQLGFINTADSIEGLSIGFLNFIKHGFNRLEISKSETFDATVGIKFGTPAFYNILELSSPRLKGERSIFKSSPHWALTYGMGTSFRHRRRISYQLEVLLSKINEGEFWTKKTNMLGQLRLMANWRWANHFSVFGGPSLNFFISDRYDPETKNFRSSVFQEEYETIYETVSESKHQKIQIWVGYKFGIRF